MEAGGLVAEAGWGEFDFSLYSEESEIMTQLLGAFPCHSEEGHQVLPWSDQASSAYSGSIGGSLVVPLPRAYEGYYLSNSNEGLDIRSCVAPDDQSLVQDQGAAEFLNVFSNHSLNLYGNGDLSHLDLYDPSRSMLSSASAANKRKHMVEELGGQTKGRKCAWKAETKRTKKGKQSRDEDASVATTSRSPTSCSTADIDSNASQVSADAYASPKGKARAARGTATEPQSIYARKRRERINERLKVLQNIVPNGTKVDISTMLEEAVHYVKFLQVQIKLLSSDDLWMYAPIAYNGINIGIDMNTGR